jgi:thiosulfate/3-mercaptopyruvate sulfurtransferase
LKIKKIKKEMLQRVTRRNFTSKMLMETTQLKSMLGQDNLTIVHACINHVNKANFDFREYHLENRIKNSIYFSINELSDKTSKKPHMMPSEEIFKESMKKMCIRKSDTIVVYDSFGMAAAPRVSWMLRAFGCKNVKVLNGTFDRWCDEGLPISKGQEANEAFSRSGTRPKTQALAYEYKLDSSMIETYKTIQGKTLIDTRKSKVY